MLSIYQLEDINYLYSIQPRSVLICDPKDPMAWYGMGYDRVLYRKFDTRHTEIPGGSYSSRPPPTHFTHPPIHPSIRSSLDRIKQALISSA